MSDTPRIVREAEKIVRGLYKRMEKYERWRQNAVAESVEAHNRPESQ